MSYIQQSSPEGSTERCTRPVYTGRETPDGALLIVDDLGGDDAQRWLESDVWWDDVR